MAKHFKGNHSIITWEDKYYDGLELDHYDERDVSDWMLGGTEDCIEYIEKYDDVIIRLKNEAQNKYYREPYKLVDKNNNKKENSLIK